MQAADDDRPRRNRQEPARRRSGCARRAREFVALEALALPSQIAPHVARKLGLSFRGDADPEALVANHVQAESCLLVLDNFEHLIDGAALLLRWLANARAFSCS